MTNMTTRQALLVTFAALMLGCVAGSLLTTSLLPAAGFVWSAVVVAALCRGQARTTRRLCR